MRTTSFPIYNEQLIEVFSSKCRGKRSTYEVWIVGQHKKQRTVIGHFLCGENLEKRMRYSTRESLAWSAANNSDLPNVFSASAIEWEEPIRKGTVVKFEEVCVYFTSIIFIDLDRKTWNRAAKLILGRWTDGKCTLEFSTGAQFRISCQKPTQHSFLRLAISCQADWWNFKSWMLFILNQGKSQGARVGILRCDDNELHIAGGAADELAHVFRRVSA